VSGYRAQNGTRNYVKVGFWSSMAYTFMLVALNITFAVMAIQESGSEWQGIESYALSYHLIAFVPQVIGLASIPALILMLASIHVYALPSRRHWSLAGFGFGIAYAVLLGSLYFIQVGVLLPALTRGDWVGLDQLAFANRRSIAWGLDYFAWSMLGVSLLLTAWVFEGDRLNRWIRSLFILNGIANLSLILASPFEIIWLTLGVAFLSWIVALPAATILVAIRFRKALREVRTGIGFIT
jgi:hypothetical protein